MKRLAATFAATIALISAGGLSVTAASADGGGPNNVVHVVTTGTNDVQERASTKIGSYGGDDLQSANVARAESHDCTDCRNVAVAVQAVFATGHPSTVEPANAAVATNENCTRCTTFAWAYQYVVETSGPVRLSGDDRAQIADVRQRIDEVAHSDLPPAALDSQLQELGAEFKADVDAAVSHSDEHGHGHVYEDESDKPAD